MVKFLTMAGVGGMKRNHGRDVWKVESAFLVAWITAGEGREVVEGDHQACGSGQLADSGI